MTIPNGVRTPGIYTDYNLNTQRSNLPAATQKILFLTTDTFAASNNGMPQELYDTNAANTLFGSGSNAGAMMTAALQVYGGIEVEVLGKQPVSIPA